MTIFFSNVQFKVFANHLLPGLFLGTLKYPLVNLVLVKLLIRPRLSPHMPYYRSQLYNNIKNKILNAVIKFGPLMKVRSMDRQ